MGKLQFADRIGIWELDRATGWYERTAGDWDRWADLPRFVAVPDRPRILLFGESVARGLFYDPLCPLAGLIAQHLGPAAEVIDLARTGARMEHVSQTAAAARCLMPDAVVLFAGNNWKYALSSSLSPASRRAEASAVEAGSVAGLLRYRESALVGVARRAVADFCGVFDGVTSVFVVVPESNLLDWHCRALAPVLGGGREQRWLFLIRRLEDAMRAADWDLVLHLADELDALDGGVADGPHRARARAYLERGDTGAALASYRRARDVRLWCHSIDPSWLPSCGAAAARETAARHGAGVIDLTEILPAHARSGIPDSSLFADFCHLNSTGLTITAAAIADRLAAEVGAAERGRLHIAVPPGPAVESGAHFCAALVSADFAQPLDELRSHARVAAAVPEVMGAMEAYCAVPASRAPWWMRPTEFSVLPNVRRYVRGVGLTEGYRYDQRLVEVFWEQIDAGRPMASGPRARPDWALAARVRTDLLDPIFAPAWRPEGWEGLFDGEDPQRHYFRAYTERSLFRFNLMEPAALDVELTARLGTPGECLAQLSLNGQFMGAIPLADRWRVRQLAVPADATRAGRNDIEIRWERAAFQTQPPATAARLIGQGLLPDLHLVFGELYSLHVTWNPVEPACAEVRDTP